MDKIKEICCDDSIEEPIKKEVSDVLSFSFPLISSKADKILMLKKQEFKAGLFIL